MELKDILTKRNDQLRLIAIYKIISEYTTVPGIKFSIFWGQIMKGFSSSVVV